MLIQYYATDSEDSKIEKLLKDYPIKEWFNPEDGFYVMDTDDERIPTILALLGIEVYLVDTKETWLSHAFESNKTP